LLAAILFATASLDAQSIDKMSGDQLMQLMLSQPKLAMDRPVAPMASFDPPVIAVGGKAMYRVSLHTLDEAITHWPDKMPVPPQLQMTRGAEGMTFNYGPGTMQPLTVVNFHVSATRAGVYVMPSFVVEIYGQPVTIPEAQLEVVTSGSNLTPLRELRLQPERTNVYVGESVRVRVLGPVSEDRSIQALGEVQLNGDGFITGKNDVSQQISMMTQPNGESLPTYIYGTSLTPFAQGALSISAQAFTAGNQFSGRMVIHGRMTISGGPPEFALLESPPVVLNVQPLPSQGRLPGFSGAIGKFSREMPRLSSVTVPVGSPIKLSVTIRSPARIAHLAMPPATETPAWEAFATGSPVMGGDGATFTYTLIPQTDQTPVTPEIPFCYFDPDLGKYVDLSIPAMPVKVTPATGAGATPNAVTPRAAAAVPEKKLSLSGPAPTMGQTATSLVPLQERGWFWAVEWGPVLGLAALWLESRRRQFWEEHPDLWRRREARRALHRERRKLRAAAEAQDARGFAASGVQAIRLACAPHFPAEPRALVCGDVLQLLPEAERLGENGTVVRRFFLETDALDFAGVPGDTSRLLELQSQLDRLLTTLEVRL
jgi:hypothetical protein